MKPGIMAGVLRRLTLIRRDRPPGIADGDAVAYRRDGGQGSLRLLSCDVTLRLSGLLQFRVAWANPGDTALPPARLVLAWRMMGAGEATRALRQEALDLAALSPGEETVASVQLGVPLIAPCTVELAWEVEDRTGEAWPPAGSPLTRHLDVTEPAGEPDFDYVAAYRAADLTRDWWSIVGPSSREEHEALGRDKLRQLQALGFYGASRVLDIGCGTGQLAEHVLPMLSPSGRYVGTDIAGDAVAFCQARFAAPNVLFLRNDWSRIPLDDAEFDFVYLGSVLPHLYPTEIRVLLAEACRLLAPGGQIVADAFVSPTVPGHAGNRGMVQLGEAWLRGLFTELGLAVQELGAAPWNADCRRVAYRLSAARRFGSGAPEPLRDGLLVLGMHRSGTSVVTRLLSIMGATPPHDLAPGGEGSPDGYWEPAGVVRAMEDMLAAADSAWFDWRPLDTASLAAEAMAPHREALADAIRASFGTAPRIVLKDPRACRAAGLLRALLVREGTTPHAVLVLRNPAAVATSLRLRDRISASYAGLLWARHMLAAEAATRDMPRLLVDYDALVANPAAEIARIAAFLPWPVDAQDERANAILRPPAGAPAECFVPALGAALGGLHAALAQLARRDDAADRAAVDGAATQVEAVARDLAPALAAEFAHLRATGRNMQPHIPRPPGDALVFAEAMERLHGRLAGAAAAPARAIAQHPRSALRSFLHRGEDIYAGFMPDPCATDMQGWNSDHPILAWAIATLRPQLVIEVGTWKGRSAIAMARAMDAHGVDGEVLCVDTWLGSPEHWLATGRRQPWRDSLRLVHGYPGLYRTFLNNVVSAGMQDRITPLPLPSDAAFQILREHAPVAGLIYIDAGHDEDSVARDLRLYWQFLARGGALVMDDYGENWHGVRRAVDRFAGEHGLEVQSGGGKALLSSDPGLRAPADVLSG